MFEWTPTYIVIAVIVAVVVLVVDYLLASLRQSRRIGRLLGDLERQRRDLETAQAEQARLDAAVAQLQGEVRDYELAGSRMEAQLDHARGERDTVRTELEAARTGLRTEQEGRTAAEKRLEGARSENSGLHQQLVALQERLERETGKLEALRGEHQSLNAQHTQLETTLEQKEAHFRQQMQQLSDAKKQLSQEFENLANRIFEEKNKRFTEVSQAGIDSLLKPFREQISGFQQRVNEVHDQSLKGHSNLMAEIKHVLEIGQHMSSEANNLTAALKGDSQQRGAWGEAQLERTLEMSGLVEEEHYQAQTAFKDEAGTRRRTDYLIKLPDGKQIIIDSKVTLNAYERYVSAETPEAAQRAMAEHILATRRHIDDLASKDYSNLIGMRSPNFVLMFMPIEPAYIEALKADRGLFEYGFRKNVVLVSHTTLIPILRTVSNLWMLERSNKAARELANRAGSIYNQVCLVAERLAKLGGTLGTASQHYNDTVTAMVGQRGLHGKVARFKELSAKASKRLPNLDVKHLDFETQRLQLAAEALPEEPEEDTPESQELEISGKPELAEPEELESKKPQELGEPGEGDEIEDPEDSEDSEDSEDLEETENPEDPEESEDSEDSESSPTNAGNPNA